MRFRIEKILPILGLLEKSLVFRIVTRVAGELRDGEVGVGELERTGCGDVVFSMGA